VRFFFDNNLPPKLAKSLHVLVEPNHQVVHLKDRFAAKTTDETWMAALSKEQDWIIVSGDVQIRKTRTKCRLGERRDTRYFFSRRAGSIFHFGFRRGNL